MSQLMDKELDALCLSERREKYGKMEFCFKMVLLLGVILVSLLNIPFLYPFEY